MPLYLYKCEKCKAEFEVLLPVSQKGKKVVCISCGSKETKKIPAPFSSKSKNNSGGFTCGGRCSSCSGCSL